MRVWRMRNLVLLLASSIAALPSSSAHALSVSYAATDLADTVQGEDLYRYDYAVDSFIHPAGFGFSVFFDPTLFASLQSPPPPVGGDWDIISVEPDVELPDDGLYDALALVSNPSQLSGFSIEFVWLGSGAPGAQPFVVYDTSFGAVESGATVAVPEPGTFALLAIGIVGFGLAARRPLRWSWEA